MHKKDTSASTPSETSPRHGPAFTGDGVQCGHFPRVERCLKEDFAGTQQRSMRTTIEEAIESRLGHTARGDVSPVSASKRKNRSSRHSRDSPASVTPQSEEKEETGQHQSAFLEKIGQSMLSVLSHRADTRSDFWEHAADGSLLHAKCLCPQG